MINPLLNPVIELLEHNKASEDEIADALTDIITSATMMLYKKAIEEFSEEDIEAIEHCEDEKKTNDLIAQIYASKVGISPAQLTDIFLKEFVDNFINDHEQESSTGNEK